MRRSPSIRKDSESQKIYKSGTSYTNRLSVMYVVENGKDGNRIGVSVSKKVGSSVVRHHITRSIREASRSNGYRLKIGLNIIVVARVVVKTSEYKDSEGVYMHLCGLHRILRGSK